jgi:hypothetical protein
VSCVGAPPVDPVLRASGVSDVEVDGSILRCRVSGSFQPFLEALRGREVISLRTALDAPQSQPLTGQTGQDAMGGGTMKPTNLAGRTVGLLFIAATAASLIGSALLNPVLHSSDYLATIFANQGRVITGSFFWIVAGMTSAGIAMALYPVLRGHGQGLAIGSVGFRVVEGTLYIIGALCALLLVTLSQQAAAAGTAALSSDQAAGALLLALRDWANLVGTLAAYTGATMYYYIFLRSRLIPRWLSGWGIVGTTLGMAAALLVLFGFTSQLSTLQVAFNLPFFLNEMVLAVWLIVKGFTTSPAAAEPLRQRAPVPLSR